MAPESRAVLDAFTAGVNGYLALGSAAAHRTSRSPASRRSRGPPADCCAVFLVRHVVFANWQKKLWRGRLVSLLGAEAVARLEGVDPANRPAHRPAPRRDRAPTGRPRRRSRWCSRRWPPAAEPAAGSNSWALDGTRTASGLPLVAGDPHRALEVPGVYAQGHLACDEFDADRTVVRRRPRLPALRAQRSRRMVRHQRAGRLPGPLRRGRRRGARRARAIEVVEVRDQPAVRDRVPRDATRSRRLR